MAVASSLLLLLLMCFLLEDQEGLVLVLLGEHCHLQYWQSLVLPVSKVPVVP